MGPSTRTGALAGEPDGDGAVALAMSLLERQAAVEEFLSQANRLDAFVERLARWREQHPQRGAVNAKAQALRDIVTEFGLTQLVLPAKGPTQTRGPVRTRGAFRSATRSAGQERPDGDMTGGSADIAALLDRVAATYRRTA